MTLAHRVLVLAVVPVGTAGIDLGLEPAHVGCGALVRMHPATSMVTGLGGAVAPRR